MPEEGGAAGAGEPRAPGADLLGLLLEDLTGAVEGCVGAGVSVVDRRGGRSLATAGVAGAIEAAQWASGQGPLWDAAAATRDLVLPERGQGLDLSRWPHLLAGGTASGVGGLVVAVAVSPVGTGTRAGSANGEGAAAGESGRPAKDHAARPVPSAPGPRPDSAMALCSIYLSAPPDRTAVVQLDTLARLLARTAELVDVSMAERRRADQLQDMVQYRRVIEQAKGLLMAALGVDAGAAFGTLTRASQYFNVRLRRLAVALVEHVGTEPAEVPGTDGTTLLSSPADLQVAAQVWAALAAPGRQAGGQGATARHLQGRSAPHDPDPAGRNGSPDLIDLTAADETGMDETGMDETGMDETGMDETGMDETGMDETGMDETGMDETGMDETGMDETGMDETGMDEPSGSMSRPGTAGPPGGAGQGGG